MSVSALPERLSEAARGFASRRGEGLETYLETKTVWTKLS
jgi:hypothetical protein